MAETKMGEGDRHTNGERDLSLLLFLCRCALAFSSASNTRIRGADGTGAAREKMRIPANFLRKWFVPLY